MVENFSLGDNEFTLSRLGELAEEREKEKILFSKEELSSIAKELEETNQQNNVLIKEALDYVDIVFSLLVGETGEDEGYTSLKSGKKKNAHSRSGILIDGTV